MLDEPLFDECAVTFDEYEEAPDLDEPQSYVFLRHRRGDVRRFRVPPGKWELFDKIEQLFDKIEQLFDLIDKAVETHSRLTCALREGDESTTPSVVDRLACLCINIGQLYVEVGGDLMHREKSRPRRDRRKLTDPAEIEAAIDEIRRQLRGSRRTSFTAATNRAAAHLRRQRIEVSGKFLRDRFPDLNPKNQG